MRLTVADGVLDSQADQLVARVNDIERRKMEEIRDRRYALDDEGVRLRRREEDIKGGLSPQGEALRRAVRKWTDDLRARRRGAHPRLDPHFHNNALSFDSGNRNSHSSEETRWRETKK